MISKIFFMVALTALISVPTFAGIKEVGNGGTAEISKNVQCVPQSAVGFPMVSFSGMEPLTNGDIVRVIYAFNSDSTEAQFTPVSYQMKMTEPPPKESIGCGGDCFWYKETFELLFKPGTKLRVSIKKANISQQFASGDGIIIYGTKEIPMKCTLQVGYGN
jgi:hypothetical protein